MIKDTNGLVAGSLTWRIPSCSGANKTARMVWALMTNGERYREPIIAYIETRRAIADEVGKGGQELMQKAG